MTYFYRGVVMYRFISIDNSVCTGCRECEVVCSLIHFGESNPARSAIRVIRKESNGITTALPVVCQHCTEPLCIEACPIDAISKDDKNNILVVNREECIGCGNCIEACPAHCIIMDDVNNTPITCDLCGGDPQCVQLCHSACLTLKEADDPSGNQRIHQLAEIMENEFL